MKTFLLASSAVWKVPLWFLKLKILADLKGSAWCLLIWKVVIYRTYDENFPSSLISGVKILADLKGSAWLCWFEKLSLFNLDSRCSALIGGQARYLYFFANRKTPFHPLTCKRYSMHHYFQESSPSTILQRGSMGWKRSWCTFKHTPKVDAET